MFSFEFNSPLEGWQACLTGWNSSVLVGAGEFYYRIIGKFLELVGVGVI